MVSVRRDGGAETLVRTLIDELTHSHYRFDIFTMRNVRDEHALDINEHHVKIHAFPGRRLFNPSRIVGLYRALRDGHYDVIHTHIPSATILGALLGTVLRIPVVATLHNSTTQADGHWFHGRLETYLLRHRVRRIIAVGRRTAEVRQAVLGDVEVHVLDNAVPPSVELPAADRQRLRDEIMRDPSLPLVLAVGRLTAQKAHDDLLRAVALALAGGTDFELAIAGRGTREDELRALIGELGLDGRAHLLGTRADVKAIMRASELFVMSSHWEGLPVALLEAMEAGMPIVSTSVGDVPTVLGAGCGRLVPPADVEGLAAAITEALRDHDPACIEANRRLIDERYSSHTWARQVAEHYEAAIAG